MKLIGGLGSRLDRIRANEAASYAFSIEQQPSSNSDHISENVGDNDALIYTIASNAAVDAEKALSCKMGALR